jgi:hypothetical protein
MTLTYNFWRRSTTVDRPVANRLQRARAVSTFVRGFSVRHRNVQAVQVRRQLTPPPPSLQALLHAPPVLGFN